MRFLLVLALLTTGVGASAESFTLDGRSVAVFNLAGSVRIEAGGGSSVAVDVQLNGPDADRLSVDTLTTEVRGKRTTVLVVRYPDDDVVYDADNWRGRTEVKVAQDGTFHRSRGGRRIRVRSSGSGTRAYADIVMRVPADHAVSAWLAVGEMRAADVVGDLYLDTHQGTIEADRIAGNLVADSGSGDVRLDAVDGQEIDADTGSGNISFVNVYAQRVRADTGSGRVIMRGVRADTLIADTGSGDVDVEYAGSDGRLSLDTGSGNVRVVLPAGVGVNLDVDTGSGSIASRLEGLEVLDRDDDKLVARRGGGELRLRVDTGSGNVKLAE